MDLKKLALVPAIVALGLYVTTATWAGEDKNGGDTPTTENGDAGHDKNGGDEKGGDGHDKNAGDNGGKDNDDNDNDDKDDGKDNGDNGKGKNDPDVDEKPDPTIKPRPDKPRVIISHGGNSGGSSTDDYGSRRNVRCVIGGYVYYVYRRHECGVRKMHMDSGYAHGGYAYDGGDDYVVVKRKYGKRVRVRQQIVVEGGGYGYVYAQPRRIRYYSPASPAAMMQAKKRARKAAAYAYEAGSYGYGEGVGYSYGEGYADQQVVVVRKARKLKKHRRRVVVQQPVMDYGYDDGYGPIVTKGGNY